MRVDVLLEQRFCMMPDDSVWTPASFSYSFWERYLAVFAEVRIFARVARVNEPQENWRRVDGEGVTVAGLPYYLGPYQFLLKRRALRRALVHSLDRNSAVILRVPSPIGTIAVELLGAHAQPYGVEVLGDPWDVFAAGVVQHPFRLYFRWRGFRDLRYVVKQAAAAAYVTKYALQRRYPAREAAFTSHYSSIELPPHAFVAGPRTWHCSPRNGRRVVSVGSLEQLYKAPDIAIEAVAQCAASGDDIELIWVGDGRYRANVEAIARSTQCPERFHFMGNLAGADCVRRELDKADVFLLVSRTEGLPRSLIEAMARGLPCIGSRVGGIPELLPDECLVPPNDSRALAAKILELLRDPKRMQTLSARNLRKAREYRDEELAPRRTEFYRQVREATERYMKEAL